MTIPTMPSHAVRVWSDGRRVPTVEPFERPARDATFSPDGVYRYRLTRAFGHGAKCLFVMLNPSTADEQRDDPTIRRCVHFAQREGCAVLRVVNLFAFRTSKPRELRSAEDPIGVANNSAIRDSAACADLIIAAWGFGGFLAFNDRGAAARQIENVRTILTAFRPVYCLGLTKGGAPKHPLARGAHRIPDDQPLIRFWEKAQ